MEHGSQMQCSGSTGAAVAPSSRRAYNAVCSCCTASRIKQLCSNSKKDAQHLQPYAPTCKLGLQHREALLCLGCAGLKLGKGSGVHAAASCGAADVEGAEGASRRWPSEGAAAAAAGGGGGRRRRRQAAAAQSGGGPSFRAACLLHLVAYLIMQNRGLQRPLEREGAELALLWAATDRRSREACDSITEVSGSPARPLAPEQAPGWLQKGPLRTCERAIRRQGDGDCLNAPCTLIKPTHRRHDRHSGMRCDATASPSYFTTAQASAVGRLLYKPHQRKGIRCTTSKTVMEGAKQSGRYASASAVSVQTKRRKGGQEGLVA